MPRVENAQHWLYQRGVCSETASLSLSSGVFQGKMSAKGGTYFLGQDTDSTNEDWQSLWLCCLLSRCKHAWGSQVCMMHAPRRRMQWMNPDIMKRPHSHQTAQSLRVFTSAVIRTLLVTFLKAHCRAACNSPHVVFMLQIHIQVVWKVWNT